MTGTHEIFREFTFEAAHRLPNVPTDHKCSRLHGHSYRVLVRVEGPLDVELGWVQDFGELKAAWKSVEAEVDHHYLNEVPGLENPTSERLAEWIWVRLVRELPRLSEVEIRETCTAGCVYRGSAAHRLG